MPKNEQLVADARNRFKEMPEDIFKEMSAVADRNGRFYVPHRRATDWGLADSLFGFEPRNELDGGLSFREIRALLLVHNEVRELTAMFDYGGGSEVAVRQVLGLESNDYPGEVLRGMADFVQNMGFVAGIRDMIAREEGRPEGSTMEQKNRRIWWARFEQKIVDDHLHLGVSVSRRLVEMLRERAIVNTIYTNDVETMRLKSYALGVELAAQLYLADLDLDSGELDSASNF